MLQLDNSSRSSQLAEVMPALVRGRALASWFWLLLCVVMASTAPGSAWQTGGTVPPANPLGSILNQKPKAPVANQELPAALPEQAAAIPLPDIAARSLGLNQALRDAAAKLPTREQLDQIQASISEIEPDLETKRNEVNTLLAGNPSSLEVREEETFWRDLQAYTANWQQQLSQWANADQVAINMLDAEEPRWAATLEENEGNKELGPVLTVISGNLQEIRNLRKQAQDVLQTVVKLQVKVGSIDQLAADQVSQLGLAKASLKGHLLDRDSLPLWRIKSRREIGESSSVSRSVSSRWISVVSFLKASRGSIVFLLVLLMVCEVAAKQLHDIVRNKQPTDEIEVDAYRILGHWYAVGLLPPLIVGYLLAPSAPLSLIGFVILLSFFPILVVLPPLLHGRMRTMLYLLAGLYGFNWVISWVGLNPSTRREIQFVANACLFCVLAYLVRPSRSLPPPTTWRGRLLVLGVRLGVAVLGISLVADLFGYVKLAHFLSLACVYGAFVAISVYTALRAFNLLLTVGLRSPAAEHIAAVRLHREEIARWVPRAVQWVGIVIWIVSALQLLGLDDAFRASLASILSFPIAGKSSGATLGGILGFFVILVVGYGIANVIRFLFREEILRRFHMSRGLPELIASLVYYLLMLFVVLAAVNAAGIELNKFTVLTGAFGVGIGFGLQNIVNNFVSGLILQFERPIHLNDVLEVDNNLGKVTRIGIRSSTIQTAQGAEVIIPNATLISNKVINWTLSESNRRRELPVGVAYGTDPKMVLKILREAAARNELVLTKPEPIAYFKGFGESSLDFELHFWVMQENNAMQITSEVAMAAMQMLEDAGIEIPFPQRDLHLRSLDSAAAGALTSGASGRLLSPVDAPYEPVSREADRSRKAVRD